MGMWWEALAERLPKGHYIVGAEVGVWQGRMSCALLMSMPELYLYMIDTWTPAKPGSVYRSSGDKCANATQSDMNQAMITAKAATQFAADRRAMWCMDSLEASGAFMEFPPIDFVFLDANHTRQAVSNDLQLWGDVVISGGLLCGHDYNSPRWGGEVNPAVDEYALRYGYEVEVGDDHTWFLRKG